MAERKKPPAFFCPDCGQKHRADLTPLERDPGKAHRAPCRRCGAVLAVRLAHGRPSVEVLEKGRPMARIEEPAPAPSTALPGGPYDAPTVAPLESGARVGRYTIKALLREGGTSTVYRANDPTTKRMVALKVLRADATDAQREDFLNQVEVQANIRHPNIMPVYDRGTLDDGRPFFTMELLHRPLTLAEVLERRANGRIERERSLASLIPLRGIVENVLLPVADGIFVANVENGVLHRDLRPANVLLDGKTLRPYVIDFGSSANLAKPSAARPSPLSQWLAPEQAAGQIHARTDVWGLGALLHASITGKPPLEGEGDELRRRAISGHYGELDADAPAELKAITRKAMTVDPDGRYVNGRQLATDIKAWLKGGHVRALEVFGGEGAASAETRRARKLTLQIAAFVAAGLVVGLLVGSRIRLGGGDVDEVRIRAVQSAVDRLDQDVTNLVSIAPDLSPSEAHRVWRDLDTRADDLAMRLEGLPGTGGRASVEARLQYVRERFAPAQVRIEAPEGVRLEATTNASDARRVWEPGLIEVPPGRWSVETGTVRFPAVAPLLVRAAGATHGTEAPSGIWSLPSNPAALRGARALVLGCSIRVDRPPEATASAVVEVPTFLIDRDPVSHVDYARFLNTMPEAERPAHAPPDGFEVVRGVYRPLGPTARHPVLGVRPIDARAYAAWAAADKGLALRLPTAAEWLLASRGPQASASDPGDLEEQPGENPYGIRGLDAESRELATLDADTVELTRLGHRSLPEATASQGAAFRCVQDLQAE